MREDRFFSRDERRQPKFEVCENGCAEIVFINGICLDCFSLKQKHFFKVMKEPPKHEFKSSPPVPITKKRRKRKKKPKPPCSFEGCNNPRSNLKTGLCSGHQQQVKRGKPLKPLRRKWPAQCMVPSCEGKHKSGGYCNKCYLRTPRPLRWEEDWQHPKHEGTCRVLDCQVEVAGLICEPHLLETEATEAEWKRKRSRPKQKGVDSRKNPPKWVYNGAIVTLNDKGERICNLEGCEDPHDGHGWCRTHLGHVRQGKEPFLVIHGKWKKGDPNVTLNEHGQRICNLEGCEEIHRAHGWCDTHRQQVERGEEPYLIDPNKKRCWTRRKSKSPPPAPFSEKPWEFY